MDWVPNHTGADHPWITSHPSYYVIDSLTGQPLAPFDWSDVRELNYDNREMRDSMMAALKYWLNTVPIDGYRVDVAWGVPDDFWKECIPALKKIRPELFMLAEAEGPNFHEDGFDATYPWTFFHLMNKIAAGNSNVASLDSLIKVTDSTYPSNALRLYFTSNHDENSWNKADYGTMPGNVHAPFAVLTQTYARSLPLIYSGQEEPVLDSIRFFYKDPIAFNKLGREQFYKVLLNWRKKNPALNGSVPAVRLYTGDPKNIFSFSRESGGKKVVVVLNLSAISQKVTLQGIGSGKKGFNIFNEMEIAEDGMELSLAPWDYKVYTID
jgi:glycosidase